MVNSPRLSFKGYSFGQALFRNKDTVKYIVTILTGFSTYLGVTGFDWKTFGLAIGLGVATLLGKLLSDAVDFYFSTVDL
jgi:hypothetical protein